MKLLLEWLIVGEECIILINTSEFYNCWSYLFYAAFWFSFLNNHMFNCISSGWISVVFVFIFTQMNRASDLTRLFSAWAPQRENILSVTAIITNNSMILPRISLSSFIPCANYQVSIIATSFSTVFSESWNEETDCA